jgi:AmiR/NasT family two-component response regulator
VVNRFRVLMANPPKLMRRLLLEDLKEEPWIEIVGEATQESEIRGLAQKTAPDLVVDTADRPGRRPVICDELLSTSGDPCEQVQLRDGATTFPLAARA